MPRHILISAPFGYSIKNLLYSTFWESKVVQSAERVTVLTPTPKIYTDHFKQNKINNAVAVSLPNYTPSPLVSFIWQIRKTVFLERTKTTTEKIRWQALKRKSPLRYVIKRLLITAAKILLPAWVDRILLAVAPTLKPLFDQPDVWLSLAPSFEHELPLAKLILTKYPTTKRIAMVHSWDNLTSKGAPYARFHRILVWGELMKQEVQEKLGYIATDVAIVGMPQYDLFNEFKTARHPKKRLLYTTGHPMTVPNEDLIVEKILELLSKEFKGYQLVIRVHPNDSVERYQTVAKKFPKVTTEVEEPGSRTKANVDFWAPVHEDIAHYAELLRDSTVVLNVASTVALDASYFSTPVLCVAFDSETRPFENSVRKFYQYDHYQKIVASRGVPICWSLEELKEELRKILDNKWDTTQQAAMMKMYDPFVDGKAGQRIGDNL